jgi:hypothetical protein
VDPRKERFDRALARIDDQLLEGEISEREHRDAHEELRARYEAGEDV